jgi:parallel beta-helix repeat protein
VELVKPTETEITQLDCSLSLREKAMRWQDTGYSIIVSIITVGALSYGSFSRAQPVSEVPEEVLASPKIFSQPGSYRLKGNIIATYGGNAIEISAPNVTLDLNGYSISGGGGSTGIFAAVPNATIMNGTVRGFDVGIEGGPNCRIQNLRVTENSGPGLRVVDNCLVQNNTITFNSGPGVMSVVPPDFPPDLLITSGIPALLNNIINHNNSGNEFPQVEGQIIEMGTNICANTTFCSSTMNVVSPATHEVEKIEIGGAENQE